MWDVKISKKKNQLYSRKFKVILLIETATLHMHLGSFIYWPKNIFDWLKNHFRIASMYQTYLKKQTNFPFLKRINYLKHTRVCVYIYIELFPIM